ncbi:MAG TPA: glycosyl hydrolase family 28-related protein [Planctomycetaceae bacterium]|nr:glycosyl hydrolase family 28-related protein [Planctomycetaceae bacterium]
MSLMLRARDFYFVCALLCFPDATVARDESNPTGVFIPRDAGLVNVRDHGLRGDGKTDDTASLLKLVQANLNQHKTLFFPAGTYLLSDSIPWSNQAGEYWPWLTWQGEGRGRTIFRLRDHAPGFNDPARPKSLIKTGCYDGEARQNAAFNCYFFDLTINCGRGNPGAIGLDYCSNNNGGVIRVDILSEDGHGVTGLSMTRDSPGPALIQHLHVRGFDTGIALNHLLFGMTFESINLEGQRRSGMAIDGNVAAIRRLSSRNRVPAVRVSEWASTVVLVDSELTGGAADTAAIIARNAATLFVRNVRTDGYQHAVSWSDHRQDDTVPTGTISEWILGEKRSLFTDSPKVRSLSLPTQETPVFFGVERDWVSVTQFGATGDGKTDDAAAVQRALDAGQAVVYFPAGTYRMATPAVVRGAVRRIVGFSSSFSDAQGQTLFRFENTKHPVSLERFCFFGGGKIEHAASQPVILRHITGPEKAGVVTLGPERTWFFEDVCTSHLTLPQQTTLYARQFNCEPEPPGAGFVNDGGQVWILGLKTEWGNTIGITRNKGRTEILGGLMLPAQGFKNPDDPAFVVEDSQFSATWNEISFGTGNYRKVVRETRGTQTRQLTPPDPGTERSWSLYSTTSEQMR